MKKQALTKIISGLIIFVFVISISQFAIPIQAATETSMSNLYSNPNQSSNSTYKFKIKDVVNSNLLTNIVGCTGIVNKVATWMSTMLQSPFKTAQMAKDELERKKNQLKSACAAIKAGAQTAGQSIPTIGGLAEPIGTTMEKDPLCVKKVDSMSEKQIDLELDTQNATRARDFKEQCFDGIAITLAKNQLSAMTRSAMNWVNSGYGGNPFFVQSMTNLTNKIGKNVINTGEDILLDKAFGGKNQNPYARNFMETTMSNQGIRSSSTRFLGGLQSSLENFITQPESYYTEKGLSSAHDTRTALVRAQDANNAFARDFSVGGWDGWLSLTQTPQNNPLGFNMMASQYLADEQARKATETQNELTQNGGFLSQKTCIKWNDDVKKEMQKNLDFDKAYEKDVCDGGANYNESECYDATAITDQDTIALTSFKRECADDGWKVTTPGSIIKDKITGYLGSPERQLELAKTINDSLNALFSVLIDKLAGGGLSSLSDAANNSSNWTDTMNDYTSPDGNTTYNNNGAYDGFNLTRDLGNNYIYDNLTPLGTWNAQTNEATNTAYPKLPASKKTIKLYPNTVPENYDPKGDTTTEQDAIYPVNAYYTVGTPGNTKLMVQGYNGWATGDRAFWDGSEWQNWKAGQANPVKKRGVIQIQEDYIVAAREILKVLPGIMPKLGELDYCLPGPNPNYQINSTNAQAAYQDWIGTIFVGPVDTSNSRFGVKIDLAGDRTYENVKSIYKDNPKVFDLLSKGARFSTPIIEFSNICNSSGKNCVGNYFYAKNGSLTKNDGNHLSDKTDKMEKTLEYANNYLFKNFYDVFDRMMNELYFKNMTSKYKEYENRSIVLPTFDNSGNLLTFGDLNPAYIPMAESGLDFTKNIVSYNDDITKATTDYTDAIAQAKVNIAKLNPIKDEVSTIIQAAQKRRDDNLLLQINKEGGTIKDRTAICKAYQSSQSSCGDGSTCKTNYDKCMAANGKDLTIDLYKTIYASCLNEEDMSFFDADKTVGIGTNEADSCSDKTDNDLDGLVDCKDPDCSKDLACGGTGAGTQTVYYLLFRDGQQNFQTSAPRGTYGAGSAVGREGNLCYIVTNWQDTPFSGSPSPSIIGVTNLNKTGCSTSQTDDQESTNTVTINSTGAGTVYPSGSQSVVEGDTLIIRVTPNTGNTAITVGGTCGGASLIQQGVTIYTTNQIYANCTVTIALTP